MNIADETVTDYAFSVGITILSQRIIYKDDIEFVTEFPCLLGHPVYRPVDSAHFVMQLGLEIKNNITVVL